MNYFNWEAIINEIRQSRDFNIDRFTDIKILSVDLLTDLSKENSGLAWQSLTVPSGREENLISKLGLIKCKKSEANAKIVIGEKDSGGAYIRNKTKQYWLKSAQ